MRRGIAMIAAIVIIVSLAIPASANVTPRYSHTDYVYARLDIDTNWGIATCVGELMADNVVPVKVIVYLQVYKYGSWQTVKSWEAEDMMNVYLSKSYAIYRGYQYRTYVEGYVYDSNNVLVEIVDIADTQWYG